MHIKLEVCFIAITWAQIFVKLSNYTNTDTEYNIIMKLYIHKIQLQKI